ncbi:MAG TPA: hypothetical protein VLM89_15935 [Phycisphaerae bacterium]|nr:hypothetical protein [Phycisphaerae bacterium]
MDRRGFLKSLAGIGVMSSLEGCRVDSGRGGDKPGRENTSRPAGGPSAEGAAASRFRIGVESVLPGEGWWATIYGRFLGATFDEDIWSRSLAELGAEFTLFYDSISPAKPQACERITDMCRRHGMDFLFNNTYGDIYGPWLPGTSRAEYSDAQLADAAQAKEFKGIILDEVEHRQIHQTMGDVGRAPYLADVKGVGLQECYERILASATAVAERYRRYGGATVGEYVFPVMSHVFARAGVIPAPKFLSFSVPPVYFAINAGAAKQYGTELWVVHDFWGAEPFWGEIAPFAPGFSPEYYRSSLLLSYWLGVDATYTEALHNLILLGKLTDEERRIMQEHKLPHRSIDQNEWLFVRRFSINAYGKIHRWFAKQYVPSHPRSYTFRDLRPRVAMIRFPDTLWARPDGPRALPFRGLYGPGGPPADSRHTAWLDAWHLLTHGAVTRDGLSIYAMSAFKRFQQEIQIRTAEVDENTGRRIDYPYTERYVFCPVDGVVVFDHLVGDEHLSGVELIILTGEVVSEATSRAVIRRVEGGADCITLEHLAPGGIRRQDASCPYEVRAGRGRFLVVGDFMCEAGQRFIRRHLGPRDRIRYRFGDQVVSIRPGEGYTSFLINEADFPATRS